MKIPKEYIDRIVKNLRNHVSEYHKKQASYGGYSRDYHDLMCAATLDAAELIETMRKELEEVQKNSRV
jgi:hypothetical protein